MTPAELRDTLAPRQLVMLTVIYNFLDKHCYAPSVREIGQALGIRSTNGVSDHLRALERKGFLTRKPGLSRTIVLTADGYEAVEGDT